MTDIKKLHCKTTALPVELLVNIHAELIAKYESLVKSLIDRIDNNTTFNIRVSNIDSIIEVCAEFLHEYKAKINEYIRGNRRQFVSYVLHCTDPESILKQIHSHIDELHGILQGNLTQLSAYISQESKDEGAFSPYLFAIANIQKKLERSRRLYISSFRSLQLTRPLLFDFHTTVILVVKLVKLVMVFITLRVARTWFEADVSRKFVDNDDLTALVRRAALLILLFDSVLILFFFALGRTLASTSNRGLWISLLIDCAISDTVLLVLAAVLSRIFAVKKYFKLRENRNMNLMVFLNIVTYIAIINALIPYFFMM